LNNLKRKYWLGIPKPSWLCFIHFNESYGYLNIKKGYEEGSLLRILLRGVMLFPQYFKYLFVPLPKTSERIVVLATTKNQQDSVSQIKGEGVLCLDTLNKIGQYEISDGALFFNGLRYFPLIIGHYLSSGRYNRTVFRKCWESVIRGYGYYYIYKKWLKKNSKHVKIVVVANDHVFNFRAISMAAKKNGIKTVYIPHSSVTKNFPPLEFDYAFLEGERMKEIYDSLGSYSTQIFFSGPFRYFDYLKKKPTSLEENVIGLCIKTRDNLDDYHDYIKLLLTVDNVKIVLRPHPSEKRNIQGLIKDCRVALSDAKVDRSLDFLSNLSVLISGSSNILLEALMMDVYPIFFDSLGNGWDNYSFVENGVVAKMYVNFEDVVIDMNKPEIQNISHLKGNVEKYFSLPSDLTNHEFILCTTINELANSNSSLTYFSKIDENSYCYK